MRVAHIVSHGSLNGVGTSCKALIDRQLAAGHEVILVTEPGSWLGSHYRPDELETVLSHLKTRPAEIRRVGYLLRDRGVDVVHCHGSRANKYGMVFRIVARSAVVATAHASLFQFPWRFFPILIAPSRFAADYHARTNWVPRRNIRLIDGFLDFERIDHAVAADRPAMRAGLGLAEGDFAIGMVGAIGPRKNQVDAIRIVSRLLARHPQARLVLIGSLAPGDEPMPGWRQAIGDPLIADRLVLTGQRADALDIMAALDAQIFVSRSETGPLAVFEAMALGLPTVSYRVGRVPEILRDGDNGFMVEQGDIDGAAGRLSQLMVDSELARRIGRAGAADIRTMFDPDMLLEQVMSAYRDAIARSRPTRPANRSPITA
jgi:L-malate glycosyltransferase